MENMEKTQSAELLCHITTVPKHHSTPKEVPRCLERKSLQTLQVSPHGSGLNGGKNSHYMKKPGLTTVEDVIIKPLPNDKKDVHKNPKKDQSKTPRKVSPNVSPKKSRSGSGTLSVYTDPEPTCNQSTQTDEISKTSHSDSAFFEQEAYDLMVKEEVPEAYWKDLAEERRRALEETLDENRELTQEITRLKRENSRLLLIEEEATQLRQLLEDAFSDEDSAVDAANTSLDNSQTDQTEETSPCSL